MSGYAVSERQAAIQTWEADTDIVPSTAAIPAEMRIRVQGNLPKPATARNRNLGIGRLEQNGSPSRTTEFTQDTDRKVQVGLRRLSRIRRLSDP